MENILNLWQTNIILYLILEVIFSQFYKLSAKGAKKDGALTVILQIIAAGFVVLFSPFFEFKFPSNIEVYIFLGLAIIFYAINDRLNTTVRKGLEVSTFSILKQISTVFMIFAGLIFLKEPFILTEILGAILIIVSNVIIFYEKGSFKFDKYVLIGLIANLCFSVAMFLDVNLSEKFNLPFYIMLTLSVPAILIFIVERIKFSDLKEELKLANKKYMFATAISWGLAILCQLRAYQLGKITVIAPLCAISVILNVIAGYIFLKEKDNLLRKVIAGILIVTSVILINI